MKIAFLHYHLKTGGVTTVVRQQAEAIRRDCQCLILAGSDPDSDIPAYIVKIPELGYTQTKQKLADPAHIADAILAAIHATFDGQCDLLHVHNPTLAKNTQFLSILRHLQEKNVKLFLQIHDFAEDGRPLSYFTAAYPQNCHYGVLNSRDYGILLRAGLKVSGIHHIPNMVSPVPKMHRFAPGENYVLYPIRAIRRKNIGEAILLSLFLQENPELVITLPPNSPSDIRRYGDWKAFVKRQKLPVKFDAGLDKEFHRLVQAAKFLITTSITEGFGFSFLEPWLHDKLLWGRNLSSITSDFVKKGLQLNHLYDQILVPIDWIDRAAFFDRWQACVRHTSDVFQYPIEQNRITQAFARITANGLIDFGLLSENFQREIIQHVMDADENAEILQQINSSLRQAGRIAHSDRLIKTNKTAIMANYGERSYRRRLMQIYECVVRQPVEQRIDKSILLSEFLKLRQFSLLKWCDNDEQKNH
jgi:hypothetical protein